LSIIKESENGIRCKDAERTVTATATATTTTTQRKATHHRERVRRNERGREREGGPKNTCSTQKWKKMAA